MIDSERIIDEGHIVTSAGISAGIDMSLYLAARIYGKAVAEWTAKRMEYDWRIRRSGVQRFDAHRFYLRKQMNIVCHHSGLLL